MTTWVVGT